MLNVRRRTKITVCIWIVIAALACLVLSSGQAGATGTNTTLSEKKVATIILWYTAAGEPHNVFVLDRMHWKWIADGIVIDRSFDGRIPVSDQILVGGMFDAQNFWYYQIFDENGSVRKDILERLAPFRERAHKRLKIEEKMGL